MRRVRFAAIVASIACGLPAHATDDLAPAPTAAPPPVATSAPDNTQVLDEILVEGREPKYAAPTMRDRIGRVWAPVMINGKGPFRLVLDTGATSSAIIGSVAQRLGLPVKESSKTKLVGVTGSLIVPYVVVDQMEVGDLLISGAKLPIVPDVFGGAEGVLGTQGLADKRIYIDFRRDVLEIEYSRSKPAPAGLKRLKFDVMRGRLAMLDLNVGGVRTKAIIDTGAQQTIGNNSLREALLLRARKLNDTSVIGVTLDIEKGQSILTPPIALGDIQIRNLRITFGDMQIFNHWSLTQQPTILIGMDVIGSLETFVIDYKRRELLLRARI
jgi:predicted aspartyl protease